MSQGSKGSGCIFWIILTPLAIATASTLAFMIWMGVRRARGPEVAQVEARPQGGVKSDDPRSKNVALDGARICAVYEGLQKALTGDAVVQSAELWTKLGTAHAPDDPWRTPYEWQPWNRAIRSYGPDRSRGTPDDVIYRCPQ